MLKLLYLLLFAPFFAYSQIEIRGTVKDSLNTPIEFANVFLTNQSNDIVTGTITNQRGAFNLPVKKGSYTLTISFMGYEDWTQEVTLNENKDFENIMLSKSKNKLNEVVITASKPLVERKVDRLVFNVENSISATGGDALDALKITPRIKVKNDQISMIGKNGMSVMIDDRLIQLSRDDLINFLKTIKSDNIKSIEVITNPPAKYDAEGNNGMVNIKLKKAKADSWSNAIRSAYKQATHPSFSVGNNFTYQKNRLSLLLDVSANKDINIYTNDIKYYYPKEHWVNKIYNKSSINRVSTILNVGYNLSNTLNIGFQYLGNIGTLKKNETSSSNIYDIENLNLTRTLESVGNAKNETNNHSFNLNLLKKLDTLGKQFTVDVDYFIYDLNKNNNFNSQDSNLISSNVSTENVDNNNLQKINNFSTKIDFNMPNQWASLSFGGRMSFTETNSNIDISQYNTTNQPVVTVLNQIDNFTYNENIQAVYFSASKKLGTKWEGKVGLRAESTQNKGYSKTTNQTNKNDYFKLFPTFYFSYLLNKENTFAISYGRRVNRPSYSNLNPARWYLTPTSYEEGNPFLQPSFTSNFELSHSYKDLLTTTLSFSHTQDGFGQLTVHDLENDTQNFIRRNYYNYSLFSWSEYVNYSVFPWWNANAEALIYYTETNTYTEYLQPKYSGWGGYFSTTNDFILNKNKTILAQLTYEYNYPTIFNENRTEEYSSLVIGLKILLYQKKLQIALNANNILGTDRIKTSNITQGIFQTFRQYYDTQYVRLSLSYKFGNKNLNANKKNTSNEEEKRRAN